MKRPFKQGPRLSLIISCLIVSHALHAKDLDISVPNSEELPTQFGEIEFSYPIQCLAITNPFNHEIELSGFEFEATRVEHDLSPRPFLEIFPIMDVLCVRIVDLGWGTCPSLNLKLHRLPLVESEFKLKATEIAVRPFEKELTHFIELVDGSEKFDFSVTDCFWPTELDPLPLSPIGIVPRGHEIDVANTFWANGEQFEHGSGDEAKLPNSLVELEGEGGFYGRWGEMTYARDCNTRRFEATIVADVAVREGYSGRAEYYSRRLELVPLRRVDRELLSLVDKRTPLLGGLSPGCRLMWGDVFGIRAAKMVPEERIGITVDFHDCSPANRRIVQSIPAVRLGPGATVDLAVELRSEKSAYLSVRFRPRYRAIIGTEQQWIDDAEWMQLSASNDREPFHTIVPRSYVFEWRSTKDIYEQYVAFHPQSLQIAKQFIRSSSSDDWPTHKYDAENAAAFRRLGESISFLSAVDPEATEIVIGLSTIERRIAAAVHRGLLRNQFGTSETTSETSSNCGVCRSDPFDIRCPDWRNAEIGFPILCLKRPAAAAKIAAESYSKGFSGLAAMAFGVQSSRKYLAENSENRIALRYGLRERRDSKIPLTNVDYWIAGVTSEKVPISSEDYYYDFPALGIAYFALSRPDDAHLAQIRQLLAFPESEQSLGLWSRYAGAFVDAIRILVSDGGVRKRRIALDQLILSRADAAIEHPDTVPFLLATVRYIDEFSPAGGNSLLEKMKEFPANGSLRTLASKALSDR